MPITFSHGHGFHPWVKAPIPTQLIAVYHSFLRVDNVSGLQVLRTYHREYIIVFFKSKSSHRLKRHKATRLLARTAARTVQGGRRGNGSCDWRQVRRDGHVIAVTNFFSA